MFAPVVASAQVAIDPPPGWSDITAQTHVKGLLLALRGPESSSFVVARIPASALDGAASTKRCLARALDGLRAGAHLDYRTSGRVDSKTFRNGVTAHFMSATVDERPRLLVAVLESGGPPLLGALSSAAPDAMMAPLFGALRLGAPGQALESGAALSSDGQLTIALGGGLRSRALTPAERQQGAVLAVQDAGSEVVFLKVEGDDASPTGQAAIVRGAAAEAAKVALDRVSSARRAPTPAGPSAVYAWTRIDGSARERCAAGFLPWQYWGYSLLARGPQADELMIGVLAALKQGPSSVPGLVAASPAIEIPDEEDLNRFRRVLLGAATLVLAAIAWSLRRKNANLLL